MDSLIYDRTSSDVQNALESPNSTEFLKGSYNYTDLNRVESWCEYLQEVLATYGFSEELELKTDWTMTDYITKTQMDRIRQNIDTLKDFCYAISTETIEYDNKMSYKQANVLEQILYDIDQYINNERDDLSLYYNLGTINIQKKYITLETTSEIGMIESYYNFGSIIVKKVYTSLVIN